MRWQKWVDLCRPKKEGSLGFRDPRCFNQALLAKQAWRCLENPNSLVSQVLKAKYFPHMQFLAATIKPRCSFVWRSLMVGFSLLSKGLCYQIGDGRSVRIWEDNWLPLQRGMKPLPNLSSSDTYTWVSELINPHTFTQDCGILRDAFLPSDMEVILSIHLHMASSQDTIVWHWTENGRYSIRSGHWLAQSLSLAQEDRPTTSDITMNSKLWKTLWTLSVLPRIQHFLW